MHHRLPGIFSTVYPHIVGIRLVLFVKIFLAPVNKLPELLLFLLAGLKIISDMGFWYYEHVPIADRKYVKYSIGRFALNYDILFLHVAEYAAQIITRPFNIHIYYQQKKLISWILRTKISTYIQTGLVSYNSIYNSSDSKEFLKLSRNSLLSSSFFNPFTVHSHMTITLMP